MNIEDAKRIVFENYSAKEHSFTAELHEKCRFDKDGYWELYDAVVFLFKNGVRTDETTLYICTSYQKALRELIWHFDPNDSARISDLPNNYTDFVDKLDGAVTAYLSSNGRFLDEKRFYLNR